jgi:hypothetical protein
VGTVAYTMWFLTLITVRGVEQSKHRPRAAIVATGTAVPPQKFTQHEVAELLGIVDKKMRGLFVASHILTRHLADIDEETAGTTQKYLLDKHLRWGKQLGTQVTSYKRQARQCSVQSPGRPPSVSVGQPECQRRLPSLRGSGVLAAGLHVRLHARNACATTGG